MMEDRRFHWLMIRLALQQSIKSMKGVIGMKKGLLTLVCVISLLMLCTCGKGAVTEVHLNAEAAADTYTAEDDLYEAARMVILAEKEESEKNVVQEFGNDAYHGYTLSKVTVKKILKNETGQDVAVKESLTIIENQFTYESGNEKQVYHVNYYNKMMPGKEYILYLDYSASDKWYFIVTGMQGKIPVADDEELLCKDIVADTAGEQDEGYEDLLSIQTEIRNQAIKRLD